MRFFKQFPHPKAPIFPNNKINVTDTDAVGDGKTNCTAAFEKAIEYISSVGGGYVIVPKGVYVSGPIRLRSNINLYLEKGAVVSFTDEFEAYLPAVPVRIEGIMCYNYSPLIYGLNLENVAVTGEGTLFGNGEKWWRMCEKNAGIKDLHDKARESVPLSDRVYGSGKWKIRMNFLQFVNCKNVWIQGVKFMDSPMWTIVPTFCENVLIQGVRIFSRKNSHNTDSIDLDSCRNCLVENCEIEASSDDCICVKSGRGIDGREINRPTENVEVRNCKFMNSGSCLVVGSETAGGVKNVYMHDCVAIDVANLISLKVCFGNGNTVENVDFENVYAKRSLFGIHFWVYELGEQAPDNLSDEALCLMPEARNISVSNVNVDLCWHAVFIKGFSKKKFGNIWLDNINITGVETGLHISEVSEGHLDHINVKSDMAYAFDWEGMLNGSASESYKIAYQKEMEERTRILGVCEV